MLQIAFNLPYKQFLAEGTIDSLTNELTRGSFEFKVML